MTKQQPPDVSELSEQQIDVTAAEWLMIIVTGFTGVFAGPFAILPGAVLLGMFAYRVNPELMRNTAAGQWVRGFLPAPAEEQDEQQPTKGTTRTPSAAVAQGQPATRGQTANGQSATPARELKMLTLDQIAKCSTILLVGSRGSGKSTLLRAILATKTEAIAVYDPHAAPTDWPMATMLHNDETSISNGLVSAYKRLSTRRHERRTGVRTEGWPKVTLAADEWGSIVSNVKLPDSIKRTPGEVSTELMKEGRKFEIGFVAGAHGKTNKSLGCEGDQEAFLQSFDWIINLGGFTRKMLAKDHADLIDQLPMGTNAQGGTFPLVVVCESNMGELRLLDMRGLDTTVYTPRQAVRSTAPWQAPRPRPDDALIAGLLSGGTSSPNLPQQAPNQGIIDQEPPAQGTGSQGGIADTNAVEPPEQGTGSRTSGTGSQSTAPDLELIEALVIAGWSGNRICERIRGKRKTTLSIVKQLREGVALNKICLDESLTEPPNNNDTDPELEGPF